MSHNLHKFSIIYIIISNRPIKNATKISMLFTIVMHYTFNITSLSVMYSLPSYIICRLYCQYDVGFHIQKPTHTMLTHEGEIRKQGRQCTYNVTLKRVRVATVAVEKQQVLYSLSLCV